MSSAFSWQNSVSLCPASFCTPRSNLPVTPGISWLPTIAFHSPPLWWKGHLLLALILEGLVGCHRSIYWQFPSLLILLPPPPSSQEFCSIVELISVFKVPVSLLSFFFSILNVSKPLPFLRSFSISAFPLVFTLLFLTLTAKKKKKKLIVSYLLPSLLYFEISIFFTFLKLYCILQS